jgi:tRNA (guanosine-2'-O-)-methyltransferase
MPLLPRRFERIKAVLDHRVDDLTVVLEQVDKPHNLSAILRSCDAVGVLEAHVVSLPGRPRTFNSTAKGSHKCVPLHPHPDIATALRPLKARGFRIYGTHLGVQAVDYRSCDFTGPTAFLLGAEKWGLSPDATELVDQAIFIPMVGMVQSLNVSVAAATLLFEARRQRDAQSPAARSALATDLYQARLFEWSYPTVADWCRREGRPYPPLGEDGEILETLPRSVRLRY